MNDCRLSRPPPSGTAAGPVLPELQRPGAGKDPQAVDGEDDARVAPQRLERFQERRGAVARREAGVVVRQVLEERRIDLEGEPRFGGDPVPQRERRVPRRAGPAQTAETVPGFRAADPVEREEVPGAAPEDLLDARQISQTQESAGGRIPVVEVVADPQLLEP